MHHGDQNLQKWAGEGVGHLETLKKKKKIVGNTHVTLNITCPICRNPTLAKCEDETHTPKVGDLESSGAPEFLEFDSKGQNTSPWGVLGVIGKVLKCRCSKWPRIGHLDICSPSYGQKKGRKSNCQFDSQP
jgi:hypothetical protein